jgi:hypothetical protein
VLKRKQNLCRRNSFLRSLFQISFFTEQFSVLSFVHFWRCRLLGFIMTGNNNSRSLLMTIVLRMREKRDTDTPFLFIRIKSPNAMLFHSTLFVHTLYSHCMSLLCSIVFSLNAKWVMISARKTIEKTLIGKLTQRIKGREARNTVLLAKNACLTFSFLSKSQGTTCHDDSSNYQPTFPESVCLYIQSLTMCILWSDYLSLSLSLARNNIVTYRILGAL